MYRILEMENKAGFNENTSTNFFDISGFPLVVRSDGKIIQCFVNTYQEYEKTPVIGWYRWCFSFLGIEPVNGYEDLLITSVTFTKLKYGGVRWFGRHVNVQLKKH